MRDRSVGMQTDRLGVLPHDTEMDLGPLGVALHPSESRGRDQLAHLGQQRLGRCGVTGHGCYLSEEDQRHRPGHEVRSIELERATKLADGHVVAAGGQQRGDG